MFKKNIENQENIELSDQQKMTKALDKLSKNLTKYTSYKQVFYRGLIQGLGTALGATILTALVIGLAINLLNKVDYQSVPFIQKLSEYLQKSVDSK